jgi:hypothetical protein
LKVSSALLAVRFLTRDPNRIAAKLKAELLYGNTRLFIPWQNPPIPLRFPSADPVCGGFDPGGFTSANPTVRRFRKAAKKIER